MRRGLLRDRHEFGVEPGTPSVDDDARRVQAEISRTLPAYGEVRVKDGEIAIGVESLPHLSHAQRRLYDQAVAVTGLDPDDVLVVRVTEVAVEVDAIDTADAHWPIRTRRVTRTELHRTFSTAAAAMPWA